MMPEPNYSNQSIPEVQPKGKLIIAILLGLLTFIVTPVISIVFAIPFFFLGKVSERFNLIVIIAGIFGLRELGGFFTAQFILIGIFALLGDFATAIISLFINRSKKFALITFISALIFQLVAVTIIVPLTIKQSQRIIEAGIESEKSYQQYAKIGNVDFAIQPYSDSDREANRYPEYGPIGKKLEIIVPISVSQEGSYLVAAQYRVSKEKLSTNTPMKDVTQYLNVGNNVVKVEFLVNESGKSYGFWSPKYVGGTAQVQLYYLASEKELLDKISSDSIVGKKILERFLKDEGLDKRAPQTKPTINKFVERKEVQF